MPLPLCVVCCRIGLRSVVCNPNVVGGADASHTSNTCRSPFSFTWRVKFAEHGFVVSFLSTMPCGESLTRFHRTAGATAFRSCPDKRKAATDGVLIAAVNVADETVLMHWLACTHGAPAGGLSGKVKEVYSPLKVFLTVCCVLRPVRRAEAMELESALRAREGGMLEEGDASGQQLTSARRLRSLLSSNR